MCLTFSSIKVASFCLCFEMSPQKISSMFFHQTAVLLVRKETNLIVLAIIFTLENLWWSVQYLKEDWELVLWLPLLCQLYEYIIGILIYQSSWICSCFVGSSVWQPLVFIFPIGLVSLHSTQSLSHRLELCLPFHSAHINLKDIECSNLSVQFTNKWSNNLTIWDA